MESLWIAILEENMAPDVSYSILGPREFRNISQQSLRLRSIWYTGTHAQLRFLAFPLTTSRVFSASLSSQVSRAFYLLSHIFLL